MNGNLCRCGTYLRIREAIHKAAEPSAANKPKPAGKAPRAGASLLPAKGKK